MAVFRHSHYRYFWEKCYRNPTPASSSSSKHLSRSKEPIEGVHQIEGLSVDDGHAHLGADLPNDLAHPQANLALEYLEPILRRPDQMVSIVECRVTAGRMAGPNHRYPVVGSLVRDALALLSRIPSIELKVATGRKRGAVRKQPDDCLSHFLRPPNAAEGDARIEGLHAIPFHEIRGIYRSQYPRELSLPGFRW